METTTYVLADHCGTVYLYVYDECGMSSSLLGHRGEVTPRMLREDSGLTKDETRQLIKNGTLDIAVSQ